LQPASISEIKQALRLAAKKNITVAVVGGGHSIDAYGINPGE
jgi:FAD/FMN-containing dehydrogenase